MTLREMTDRIVIHWLHWLIQRSPQWPNGQQTTEGWPNWLIYCIDCPYLHREAIQRKWLMLYSYWLIDTDCLPRGAHSLLTRKGRTAFLRERGAQTHSLLIWVHQLNIFWEQGPISLTGGLGAFTGEVFSLYMIHPLRDHTQWKGHQGGDIVFREGR